MSIKLKTGQEELTAPEAMDQEEEEAEDAGWDDKIVSVEVSKV